MASKPYVFVVTGYFFKKGVLSVVVLERKVVLFTCENRFIFKSSELQINVGLYLIKFWNEREEKVITVIKR